MISSRVQNDFKKKIYPIENFNYIKFFSNLPPFYKWIPTTCTCNLKKNDEEICNVDRHGVFFPTVLCANCGLIRAKNYLDKKSLNDSYVYDNSNLMDGNRNNSGNTTMLPGG